MESSGIIQIAEGFGAIIRAFHTTAGTSIFKASQGEGERGAGSVGIKAPSSPTGSWRGWQGGLAAVFRRPPSPLSPRFPMS
jgi:hypothetical protein